MTDTTGQVAEDEMTQADMFMGTTAVPDPVSEAIERLAAESRDKKEEASRARVAELQAEMAEEAQIARPVLGIPRQANDIWTLSRMKTHKPTPADLNDDGAFIFYFMPVMGNAYCQERLVDRWNDYQAGTCTYSKVVIGYCEVVYEALRSNGCSWPMRETLQDAQGNDIYELKEVDGVPTEVVKSVPWPITLDNIKRLPEETVVNLINAMTRAMRGEVSGQR